MIIGYDQQFIIGLTYNDTGTTGCFFLCVLLSEDIGCLGKVIYDGYHGRHYFFYHIGYIGLYISNIGSQLCTLGTFCRCLRSDLIYHCGICAGRKHPGSLLYCIETDSCEQSEEQSQADTYHCLPEVTAMFLGFLRLRIVAACGSAHLISGVTIRASCCTLGSTMIFIAITAFCSCLIQICSTECTGCIFIAGSVTGKIIILVHIASSYPVASEKLFLPLPVSFLPLTL